MSEKKASQSRGSRKKPALPNIHPDDAKDKVFTAILKALLKKGNKPSSPKELANDIIKYKYATLGGATPFATVSSRISQHFKRAASHNPPRAPLLAKHVDQKHSRKINYSLANTDQAAIQPPMSSDEEDTPPTPPLPAAPAADDDATSPPPSTRRSTTRSRASSSASSIPPTRHSTRRRRPSRRYSPESDDDTRPAIKRSRKSSITIPLSPSSTTGLSPSPSPTHKDEDSEEDYSDYYEDMMKGDEIMAGMEFPAPPSTTATAASPARRRSSVFFRRPSLTSTASPKLMGRKLSLNGLLGEHDFWTPYSFEQDLMQPDVDLFNPTDVPSSSTANPPSLIPLNIAAPESITDKELELYFGGPSSSSSPSSSEAMSRSSRKSFTAVSNAKEASLLHQALLASTSRKQSMISLTSTATASSGDDEDDFSSQIDDDMIFPRRRSWPLTSVELESLQIDFDPKKHAPSPPPVIVSSSASSPPPSPSPDTMAISPPPSTELHDGDADDDMDEKSTDHGLHKAYTENGHSFTITKKLIGNLQCYELDSPNDIPDTKVLRFISSKDGSSEHIALRTRHADTSKQTHRGSTSDSFYLVQGCVNATQLRKAARPVLGKGSFDAEAEHKHSRLVVSLKKGPMEARGAWVPLSRARELVDEFEIESSPGLARLLSDDPMDLDKEDVEDQPEPNNTDTTPSSTSQHGTKPKTATSADEEFVKFEEDEKRGPTKTSSPEPTNPAPAPAPADAASPATSTSSSSPWVPGFSNLNLDLAKTLSSYMQTVTKANPNAKPGTPAFDLKALLTRFPALDALLKKDGPASPTITPAAAAAATSGTPPSASTSSAPATSSSSADEATLEAGDKIFPSVPTDPPMFITLLDNVSVCVATLSVTNEDHTSKYEVLRRLDTGFVNGTSLLTAGGIDTERERSMILSFEMERIRIPNPSSELYGTWIPLHRAQELAVTCSIQHRLGPFLSDRIEGYFPSPLPISRTPSTRGGKPIMALRKPSPRGLSLDKHLLSANTRKAPSLPSPSTQLQQLLFSHPYKMLNKPGYGHVSPMAMLKAPLLGSFDRSVDLAQQRQVAVITNNQTGSLPSADLSSSKSVTSDGSDHIDILDMDDDDDDDNDVNEDDDDDIVVESDLAPAQQPEPEQDNDDLDSDQDTESDTDVHEVRQRMKRMRDAAIDAMETGQSLDLEELLSRASSPIVQPFKRRRLFGIDEDEVGGSSDRLQTTIASASTFARPAAPPVFRKPANFLPHARRKPPTHHLQDKWPASKLTASMIKKSASWNGALPMTRGQPPSHIKRAPGPASALHQKRKRPDSKLANAVSTHASTIHKDDPASANASQAPASTPSKQGKKQSEPQTSDASLLDATAIRLNKSTVSDEDEDEDVDIGGSDDDDDIR
ncbi:hypothetical protein DM01DRAFT_1405674 [Hesseltinella vesiculosa]|uniref:HTH APSES-type domain-containing protein n=1 Tax=Hesseltinella vesiculosa TaxID=101127 RepID=A0A1X2GNH4_9FUNG|nr:hypothetical protein DM01DRAFT_1405674 [Hesseltinella vesiculosa]